MRTLFITGHRVNPIRGGAALRNWQNINIANQFGPVATFTVLERPHPEESEVPEILALSKEYVSDSDTGPGSIGRIRRKSWLLQARGLPRAERAFQPAGMEELGEVVSRFRPTLVVLEELWLWRYLDGVQRLSNANPKVVYDAHNVESTLRRSILMASSDQTWRQLLREKLFLKKLNAVERHLASTSDQVWVCSPQDAEELVRLHGATSPIAVIPNGVDMTQYRSLTPLGHSSDEHPGLLFVGSFGYTPNARSAEYLIHDIMPHVWSRLPSCHLMLIGRDPTESMKESADKDTRIKVYGSVPDVRRYLAEADVVVAPLLQGSGTRLKILEAFAARRPVVATSKGAEGLSVEDGVHVLIRNAPMEFANAIVDLAQSQDLRTDLAERAYDLVSKRYSWTKITNDFIAVLDDLFGGCLKGETSRHGGSECPER